MKAQLCQQSVKAERLFTAMVALKDFEGLFEASMALRLKCDYFSAGDDFQCEHPKITLGTCETQNCRRLLR